MLHLSFFVFLILGPHFPTSLDRGGAAPSSAARPRDADRDGDIKITITVKKRRKKKDDERDGRKQWNPPLRFVAAAYACVRMSHRERRVLPPPLPLQLCGEEELKKKNWFDRQLLNLDALLWNAGYVRADVFFFFLRDMKNPSNW